MIDVDLVKFDNLKMDCYRGLTLIVPLKDPFNLYHKGEIKKCEKNNIIVINPLEAYMASFCLKEEDNINIVIKIDGDYIERVYPNIMTVRFINKLEEGEELEYIFNQINELVKIDILQARFKEETRNKLVLNILRNLADNYIDYDLIKNKKDKMRLVEKSVDMIGKSIRDSRELSIGDIRKVILVSESSYSINFKEISGLSFSEYKIYAKLTYACDLLEKTSYSIEEISDILNYKSPRSLNDNFTKYLGVTPYVYKKKIVDKLATKEKNLIKDVAFKNFILRYSTINYETIYYKSQLNTDFYIEGVEKVLENKRKINIHSLDKFGDDYIDGIKKVIDHIGINYIQLNIRLSDKRQLLLVDIDKYISMQDLSQLLQLCSDNRIRLGFILDIEDRKFSDYEQDKKLLNKDLRLIKEMVERIIALQSLTRAMNYDWILDISYLLDNKYPIDSLVKYYSLRLAIMDAAFGEKTNYSLYIGGLNFEQLEDIVRKELLIKLKRKPKTIFYSIKNNYLVDLANPFLLGEARKSYRKEISYSKKLKENLVLENSEFSICSIETSFNINTYDFLYVDLALSYLYLDNIIKLEEYDFIDYHIVSQASGDIYRTEIFDKLGFKTPIFFITSFLSQMEGHIIHMEEGCIVSTNGVDYNVLLYGDLITDYYFANTKDFKNLEIYNRNIVLHIDDIYGDYKEETSIINYFYGNPRFILNDFDSDIYMTYKEKNYIFDVNRPRKTVKKIKLKGQLRENISMQPFLIKLKKYIRI